MTSDLPPMPYTYPTHTVVAEWIDRDPDDPDKEIAGITLAFEANGYWVSYRLQYDDGRAVRDALEERLEP
jgi:hypothetical protein